MVGFCYWVLKSVVVALLDDRLLALVPYLAGAEVPWLRPESHQHVSVEDFSLLRLRVLLLVALLFQEAMLFLNLAVKCSTDSWKLKILGDVPIFKSLFDLLLEYDQFVLHLGIDVALVIGGPEAPEGVANDVAKACLLLSKDVLSELRQDVLPL